MTEEQYNESWRDFVNVNRPTWPAGWLPLPAPRDTGNETIPHYAARCAAWGDAPLSATEGYREWEAAYPTRVDPPQDPQDSGGTGGRRPPKPPTPRTAG